MGSCWWRSPCWSDRRGGAAWLQWNPCFGGRWGWEARGGQAGDCLARSGQRWSTEVASSWLGDEGTGRAVPIVVSAWNTNFGFLCFSPFFLVKLCSSAPFWWPVMLVKLTMITYSSTIGGVVVGNGRTQSNQLRSLASYPQLLLKQQCQDAQLYPIATIISNPQNHNWSQSIPVKLLMLMKSPTNRLASSW